MRSNGKNIRFVARANTPFKDKDANIVGPVIYKLRQEYGEVKPQDLVNYAKNSRSEIHNYFDWNDSSAAQKWRKWQARILMNSFDIVIENQKPVKAFYNLTIENHKAYVDFATARSDKDLWQQVVDAALKEATLWRARHERYSELKPIVKAINYTERKIRSKNGQSTNARA